MQNTLQVKTALNVVYAAFGFGVGYLFWKTSCQQLDFGSSLANQVITWLTIGSFALGCAAAPTVRCVVLITLVTVINLDGQSIIQCALMAKLADTAGQNLILNFQRATNSVLCNIDVARNISKAKVDLLEKPTQEIMDDLLQGAYMSGRVGQHMPDLVDRLEHELTKLAKGGELEEMEEREAFVDKQERHYRKTQKHETDEAIEKQLQKKKKQRIRKINKQREGMLREFVNKSTYRCDDIVNGAVFLCKQWFDRKMEECVQSTWWDVLCVLYEIEKLCEQSTTNASRTLSAKNMSRMTLFDFLCTFFKALNFRFTNCGSEGNAIDRYADAYGSQLAIAEDWTEQLASEFKVGIQYKVDFPFHKPDLVTLQQMLVIVREAFGGITRLLKYLSNFLSSVGFIFILMALRTNYKWFKTFQEDITHENVYLTPTWWAIDRRRKKENRTTLKPLRPYEKKRLHNPLTLKPNDAEQKQLFRGLGKLINLLIVAVSLIIVDKQFYEMLQLAVKYSGVEVKQEGKHDINVNIEGTGSVAKMIESVVGDIDRSYTLDQQISNHHCMTTPSETDQSTAGIYLIRLRVLIASFVFPQRQSVRNVWLYNDVLRQRALYNRQRKININRMAMGGQEFPKQSWLDIQLNRYKCLWCGTFEKYHVKSCKKHERTVYYCLLCWKEEMNGKCAACILSFENVLDGEGRIKPEYRHMGHAKKSAQVANKIPEASDSSSTSTSSVPTTDKSQPFEEQEE
ncbi:DC-STAMP-like protein [Trichuris suis]|nr:DC-STAMP-like protein [Trichuris suis]